MAEFTKDQIARFAREYFQGVSPFCPNCETPLDVTESGVNQDWHSAGVSFACRRCRTSAWDNGRDRAEGRRAYTDLEKQQIIDAAWKDLQPRCPLDESYLTIGKTATIGGDHFVIRCKYCGSNFQHSPGP